ncbi:hypothetical protein [Bartonella taylorii]|uniref:hypothetical protein n=1 Tax=Bartonella taylorii TaxID=33046 RepID=UPI001ABAF216|nr:hypothetical protein [Bartonella taylorii]
MTDAIIVSVTKIKAINLSKERSIFLPVISIEQSHNAQKEKELHYGNKNKFMFSFIISVEKNMSKILSAFCIKFKINIERGKVGNNA